MMKGCVKKVKAKRMLAMLLSAVMVLSMCLPQNVSAASADDRYTGTSDIRSLLTDFQYVVKGNLKLSVTGHCVGSVAVGGSVSAENTIGDGAKRPSYMYDIKNLSIGGADGYGNSTRTVYYETSSYAWLNDDDIGSALINSPDCVMATGSLEITGDEDYILNTEYMDVPSMFPAIISQSEKWAYNDANTKAGLDENNSSRITVDFTANKVYNIDYKDFVAAEEINIVINNINDFGTGEYRINITGVGSNDLFFDGTGDPTSAGTSNIDVLVNGSKGQFLKDQFYSDESVKNGEVNLHGMKLIWNFPDATGTINWCTMGGHLVAPKANVAPEANFEGGIIANTVDSNGEAHYFPYGEFTLNEEGKAVPNDIMVKKLYLNKSYGTVNPGTQAKFTLYSDASCADEFIVPGAKDIAVNSDTGYVTFDSEELGLECGKSYYAKETVVPTGFDINETVYECAISDGGLITYREVGNSSSYSNDVPVCENFFKTSDESKGTIFVAVVEKTDNGTVNVKGATVAIELKDENGTVVVSKTGNTTDADYVVFDGLRSGKYTVTLKTIPDGYDKLSAVEREVIVNLDKTAYHTFVLKKSVADVVINVRENAVDGKEIAGGVIQITGPNGYSRTETVGSTGTVIFEDLPVGKDYKVTLIIISRAFYEELGNRESFRDYLKYKTNPNFQLSEEQYNKVITILNTLQLIVDSEHPKRHETLANLLDILLYALTRYRGEENQAKEESHNTHLFNSFYDLLISNYQCQHKIEWYAKQLCLTPKYLSTIIRQITGKSAAKWIDEVVVLHAKRLLHTRRDMNVQQIAYELGFKENATFCRFFKDQTGLRPSEYRKK